MNWRVQSYSTRKEGSDIVITEVGKQIAILQKKLPTFWKKEFKAVWVRDLPVYFHLGKIRIDRQIKIQGRAQGNLGIHSGFSSIRFRSPIAMVLCQTSKRIGD